MVLEDYFGEAILNFKTSYQYLQQKLSSNGHTLTIYWKIHIIFYHFRPFINSHKCSLVCYSEQCGFIQNLNQPGKDSNVTKNTQSIVTKLKELLLNSKRIKVED